MGQSTNAQICFGFKINEDNLPWEDLGIEEWWKEVNGFKNSFEIYDGDEAEYLPGITTEQVDTYYKERRDWEDNNPLPILLVNFCSSEYPEYIIAIPKTFLQAYRGYPEVFDPAKLVITGNQIIQLKAFCEKYKLSVEETPQWYLASYCD